MWIKVLLKRIRVTSNEDPQPFASVEKQRMHRCLLWSRLSLHCARHIDIHQRSPTRVALATLPSHDACSCGLYHSKILNAIERLPEAIVLVAHPGLYAKLNHHQTLPCWAITQFSASSTPNPPHFQNERRLRQLQNTHCFSPSLLYRPPSKNGLFTV